MEISENRLKHILSVSRKAYQIAKSRGYTEEFAQKCFMLGWIHDIGYEFSETQSDHPQKSAELLELVSDEASKRAISEHGQLTKTISPEYTILTCADMLTDSKGRSVSAEERLKDIAERYGRDSDVYNTAVQVCINIGLVNE